MHRWHCCWYAILLFYYSMLGYGFTTLDESGVHNPWGGEGGEKEPIPFPGGERGVEAN